MRSNCPKLVVGQLMVPALPSSDHAEYINPNIEVTQCMLKWSSMKAHYLNEHCNEYNVTCNEVKVPKTGLNFTSLKVNVFSFFNTSLKVKVLKLLSTVTRYFYFVTVQHWQYVR